jgi:predicted transcriptional regulator
MILPVSKHSLNRVDDGIPDLRLKLVASADKAVKSFDCATEECEGKTSDSKPYCIKCLDNLPYISEVKKTLSLREAEISVAASPEWSKIDLSGTFCSDILTFLRRKCVTPRRLAVAVDLPPEAITGYVLALRAEGLVKLCKLRGKPGSQARLIVAITDKGKKVAEDLWERR